MREVAKSREQRLAESVTRHASSLGRASGSVSAVELRLPCQRTRSKTRSSRSARSPTPPRTASVPRAGKTGSSGSRQPTLQRFVPVFIAARAPAPRPSRFAHRAAPFRKSTKSRPRLQRTWQSPSSSFSSRIALRSRLPARARPSATLSRWSTVSRRRARSAPAPLPCSHRPSLALPPTSK
jgi:hypothetical protein